MVENQEPTKTEEELAAEAQAEQEALEAEEAKAAEAAKAKEDADKKKAAVKKPAVKKEKVYYSPTSGVQLTERTDGTFYDPKANEVFTKDFLKEVANDPTSRSSVNVDPKESNERLVNPAPVSNFAGAPNGDNSGKIFAS